MKWDTKILSTFKGFQKITGVSPKEYIRSEKIDS